MVKNTKVALFRHKRNLFKKCTKRLYLDWKMTVQAFFILIVGNRRKTKIK